MVRAVYLTPGNILTALAVAFFIGWFSYKFGWHYGYEWSQQTSGFIERKINEYCRDLGYGVQADGPGRMVVECNRALEAR